MQENNPLDSRNVMRFQGSFNIRTRKAGGYFLPVSFLLAWLLSPSMLTAQNIGSLSGIIIDEETEETIPGAHVYLANTTIGDITDPDGYFNIADAQAGYYEMIVTIIGYKPFQKSVEITVGGETDLAISLKKDVYQVGEITVTDSRPKKWKRDLKRFERMFLGITQNRKGCEIENPYTLGFKREGGYFDVTADRPLIIVNKYLGYKITYILSAFSASDNQFYFVGEPLYEELEPRDEAEAQRWAERRLETYHGSFQHFLRSLASGTVKEEGFQVFLNETLNWQKSHTNLMDYFDETDAEIDLDEYVYEDILPHERLLRFSGYLHIFYLNKMMHRDFYESVAFKYAPTKEPVRAVIRLTHTGAVFNEMGFLNNPLNVARYGYWNWESGICNWLPFNYGLEPAG